MRSTTLSFSLAFAPPRFIALIVSQNHERWSRRGDGGKHATSVYHDWQFAEHGHRYGYWGWQPERSVGQDKSQSMLWFIVEWYYLGFYEFLHYFRGPRTNLVSRWPMIELVDYSSREDCEKGRRYCSETAINHYIQLAALYGTPFLL